MHYLVVCIVALLASGLTLFSGFGLGTLLLPAFLLFFPVDISVAMTAVVHLLNNLFKLALLGRQAKMKVVLKFGIPAILAALGGASLLLLMSDLQPLARYEMFGRTHDITPVKLAIGVLIAVFAVLGVSPRLERLEFGERWLPVGGLLSGFFGGLSGHQGALRSAFLIRAGLGKEGFIATGVVIACLVDFSRIGVYAQRFAVAGLQENVWLVVSATLAAFAGAYIGNRLVKKTTMRTIQIIVSVLLMVVAAGLAAGVV
jgi:uncharacterized membrane protein YfcA